MLFRNQLVSFALSEAVVAASREAVSGTETADADETAASEGPQHDGLLSSHGCLSQRRQQQSGSGSALN